MPWSKLFYDPIILPDGRQLNSLRDAAHHITDLPKAEHDAVEWQLAMEALMLVAATDSPELLAQIAVVKALNRNQRQKPMTGRQTELVGMGYLTDAKAYLKAGNALSQSDVDMYSPVYFLLCHGIELSLKAFILASGGSERELKQQDTRHHLNVLRERARALGYQPANEMTDEVIEMLAPYHSSHSFRYREPGYASLPVIADTIEVLTSMLDEISPVVWRKVRSAIPR